MTDRQDYSAHFSANLRFALSYYASISEASRRLDLSRQQLTRYLAGTSHPSRRTMRRICDFVGCDEFEMMMPHDQFRQLVRLRPPQSKASTGIPPVMEDLLAQTRRQQRPLGRYIGYYYAYYWSMSRPGFVLQSLVRIYPWNEYILYKRLERLAIPGLRPVYELYKYRGLVTLIGDRVHMIDFETISRRELSQTILYPGYRNRVDRLTGLMLGVSGSSAHQPIASRIVMDYVGSNVDLRRAIEGCQLHAGDAAQVPLSVRQYLEGDRRGAPALLRAEFN